MTTEKPAVDETDRDAKLTDPDPVTGEHPGGPRADEDPFPAIAEEVAEYLDGDPTGHDMYHVWRVFRLAMRIAEAEDADCVAREDRARRDEEAATAADVEVVGAAALTHDLHRVMGDGTGVDPETTLEEIAAVLDRAGFPGEKVPAVQHCVAVHDEYEFRGDDPAPDTLEAEILRDADNLDAIGAVGIGRTFAFGGAHGMPMWDPEGEAYSQLYHFEDKLLQLRGEMHTDAAREIADDRHEFLETFHERFRAEWHGDA